MVSLSGGSRYIPLLRTVRAAAALLHTTSFHHRQTSTDNRLLVTAAYSFGPDLLERQCSTMAVHPSHSAGSGSQSDGIKYLNQSEAIAVDEELFTEYKFSVDQLMELAGLGCAHALARKYPAASHGRVLVVCGPGNNGGDGLVCARHLTLMGYTPHLHYCTNIENIKNQLYKNLYKQCTMTGVAIIKEMPNANQLNKDYDVVVDAVFGFSFKPPVRPAFIPVIEAMAQTTSPLMSVDIPSGWDVVTGPFSGTTSLAPDTLVSLTAPKLCAKHFKGRHHVLAGRFVPGALAQKYQLQLPSYHGLDLTVDLQNNA